MKDGILIIDKPQNWTSHDCVAVCRRATGANKTGHGGTLDPMAEGVLPVFIGKATKIMEYLDLDSKTYRCRARLGVRTDTLDIWGEVLERKEVSGITPEDIVSKMDMFRGDISQMPPMYSAVRVKGKRLYQYARDGEEVEIRPRKVHISDIRVISVDMEQGTVTFDVTCSKGTYIRSICADLGDALGCGAVMEALNRTASGVFTLEGSVRADYIKTMNREEIEARLLPMDMPLGHLGKAWMNSDRARYFCSGNSIRWKQIRIEKEPEKANHDRFNSRGRRYSSIYCVYETGTGKFLGVGYRDADENVMKADKIFADVDSERQ